MRVAYYIAAAAVALRDRGLLGAAPAGARRSGWTWSSPVPGASGGTPKADVALYHVGNDPAEHGWIVEALRRRPRRRRPARVRPPPPRLGDHARPRRRRGLLARARARGRDRGPACSATRVIEQGRIEPLWETRAAGLPARAARCSTHATGLIVHSRVRRGTGARGRLRGADLAGADAGLAGAGRRSRRRSTGAPLVGCFGHVNESKRVPQLLEAFGRWRERRPTRGCSSSARWSPRLAELDLPGGVIRRDYVPEDELWSLLAACDAVVVAALADDGRDLGGGRARAVARQAARRQRRRRVPRAAGRGRDQGAGRRGRDRRRSRRALERAATSPEMGDAARRLAATEHRLDRTPMLYAAALAASVEPARAA